MKSSKTVAGQRRTRVLFSKLEKISDQLGSKATPEAVHQLRTTVRRIETLLATAGQPRTKLVKQLSQLRRRAGKVRDIDVQMAALRGIHLGSARPDKVLVMRELAKMHRKRIKKLNKALRDELAAGLAKRMKRTATRLTVRAVAAKQKDFTATALDMFSKLVQAHSPLTEQNLHEFRMDCKRVRYVAEMAEKSAPSDAVVAQLKRIQDAIGEWHDWLTLTETAAAVLANGSSPLLSVLRTTRQSKFRDALRITDEVKGVLLGMRLPLAPKKKSQSTTGLQTPAAIAAS